MEKEFIELTKDELHEKICDLEQSYAELLGDDADANTLNTIWREIKLLQAILQSRKN